MNEPTRNRLPVERNSINHKFCIGSEQTKGYVIIGMYEDGRPGEIFVKMDKQGSEVSGLIDAWAISMSMLLQLGVPLEQLCSKFRGMAFNPAGVTDNPDIRFAKSPVDYVMRWMEGKFVDTELFEDEKVDTDASA